MEWNRTGNGSPKTMDVASQSFSPAQAMWNQRSTLEALKERILFFRQAADATGYLSLYQMPQFLAATLEFAPDMILELGRARGNSTCIFTEAANRLGLGPRSVLSFDLCDWWEQWTVPRLKASLPESWFKPLAALETNILTFDFRSALANAKRVLIFWDAHGFDVAECILGAMLPEVANRPHLVMIHDLSDSRYLSPTTFDYGENGLWKGTDYSGPRLKLGTVDSAVEEVIAIVDFTIRNRLPLHSADHSLHSEFESDPDRRVEMEQRLGELFSLQADWFYFSLDQAPGRLTFPKFKPPTVFNASAQTLTAALARVRAETALSKYDEVNINPQDVKLLQAPGTHGSSWPISVETDTQAWSWGAVLPIPSYTGDGDIRNAIVRVRAKSVAGELWIGALAQDENSYVNRCLMLGTENRETLLAAIDLGSVSKIIVQNGETSQPSSVTIELASVLIPKLDSEPHESEEKK